MGQILKIRAFKIFFENGAFLKKKISFKWGTFWKQGIFLKMGHFFENGAFFWKWGIFLKIGQILKMGHFFKKMGQILKMGQKSKIWSARQMRVKYALSARESCAGIRASFTNDARASNARGYAWFTWGPWLVSCIKRSVLIPEWTTPQLCSMCLTLSPMVSLMYKAKCIHHRVNNSPIRGPKFMVVCYSVVWYCMLGHGMVWVLSIDGCFLQMGASHPSVESTHL